MTIPITAARVLRHLPSVHHLASRRCISSTPARARDLGAKYRRPLMAKETLSPVNGTTPASYIEEASAEIAAAPKRREVAVDVAGVRVPPKPVPPHEEACCMSGCVHCVLTLYAEDLEEYNKAVEAAKEELKRRGVPREQWPEAVTEDDEDVHEDDAVPADPTMAAFFALEAKIRKVKAKPKPKPVDPTMAAFLALEAKLKKK